MGLSLSDVRAVTMADFIALTDVAYGEDGRARKPTQEDIDAFMM